MTETTHPDDFAGDFEAAFTRLRHAVERACWEEHEWPDQMAVGVRAALEFATAHPAAAQTLTSRAIARGRDGFDAYERMIAHFGEYLRPGREWRLRGEELPDITETALVGGLTMLVAQRLDDGRAAELSSVAAEATQILLTPYLGSVEARRVASWRGGR